MSRIRINIEKVNQMFEDLAKFLISHRFRFIAGLVILLVLSVIGAKKIYVETSWDSYFVEGDPMLVQTDKFKELFGNDYFVSVLTECDDIYKPENLRLLRKLSEDLRDNLSYSNGTVTSLTNIEYTLGTEEGMEITQIVPDEIPTDEAGIAEIKRRVAAKPEFLKKLVSADGKNTFVIVKLRPFPEDSVWKAEGKISPDMQTGAETYDIINKPEYAPLHPNAGGMPYMSSEKMKFINVEMGRVMMLAMICAIIVMTLVTRSLRGVVSPILSSLSGILMTFGLVGYLGLYMDSTNMMIPPFLAFAVSIAYNIHLYSFFRREMLLHGKRKDAVVHAVRETGWSLLFSGLTTIVALLSFLTVMLRPIRSVGLLSAISVGFVLAVVLVVSPILLSFGKDKQPNPNVLKRGDTRMALMMESIGKFVLTHRGKILACFTIIAAISAVGMFKMEPSFDVERTMGRKVPYVSKILEMGESPLGSVYSYDLEIEFPNPDDAKKVENLKKFDEYGKYIESFPLSKRLTSILDIVKDLNRTVNENNESFYRIPDTEEQVAQLLLLYENAGGSESNYWIDYDYRYLRMMVEISTYNSNELDKEIEAITKKGKELFPEATVSAVGNIPQFTTMQQYLVKGQIRSFGISIVIVAVLLMIVFGSLRTGLIGMIPNVAPAIFVGGYLGWMGLPLDMMSATIIPMVIGLAVDDTIHFVNHTNEEFERNKNYSSAILRVYRSTGTALVMTTFIMCATFGGFMTSKCTMLFNFGFVLSIGLGSALLADLLVTPVLVKKFHIFGKENLSGKEN